MPAPRIERQRARWAGACQAWRRDSTSLSLWARDATVGQSDRGKATTASHAAW